MFLQKLQSRLQKSVFGLISTILILSIGKYKEQRNGYGRLRMPAMDAGKIMAGWRGAVTGKADISP